MGKKQFEANNILRIHCVYTCTFDSLLFVLTEFNQLDYYTYIFIFLVQRSYSTEIAQAYSVTVQQLRNKHSGFEIKSFIQILENNFSIDKRYLYQS